MVEESCQITESEVSKTFEEALQLEQISSQEWEAIFLYSTVYRTLGSKENVYSYLLGSKCIFAQTKTEHNIRM